jgi:hypothetical protein
VVLAVGLGGWFVFGGVFVVSRISFFLFGSDLCDFGGFSVLGLNVGLCTLFL